MLATLSIFTQNSDNHFCCLISSNVLFIQPLAFCRNWEQRRQKNCVTRHKQKTASKQMGDYRKFWKWNTGIGFRNRERLFLVLPIVKKKLMPTDPRFFWHVTVNTHIFFFGLSRVWSCKVVSVWRKVGYSQIRWAPVLRPKTSKTLFNCSDH